MIMEKSIALPVLLATLAIFGAQLAQAREVVLYNNNWEKQIKMGRIVAEETTVGQLKEIVVNKLELELNALRFIGHHNNPLLDDNKFVADYYDISDIVMVKMCDDITKPGPVIVDLDKKRIQVVATKDKTLGWLKNEVLGISNVNQYKVFFDEMLLEDESKTLAEYQFYKGARVLMYKKDALFEVTVKTWVGSKRSLEASLETTLKGLKEMLEEDDVEIDNLLFLHANLVMTDENRKLFTYSKSFHLGIVIKIVPRLDDKGAKLVFYYKKPGPKIEKYDVLAKSLNTVAYLKTAVFKVDTSIPVDNMNLVYQGEIMEDEKQLSDYDIYPRAWVLVEKQPVDPSTIQKRY